MRQLPFPFGSDDFNLGEAFGPPDMSHIFVPVQELTSKSSKLMAYLREYEGPPKTDKELMPILFYEVYKYLEKEKNLIINLGTNEIFNVAKEAKAKYVGKLKKVISEINTPVLKRADQFESRQKWLEHLWQKEELILVVGQTEQGEVLRDYHGPTKRQSIESLRLYLEWTTTHREKQSQPHYLARDLWEAAASAGYGFASNPTITTDYNTPDNEMDAFLDDEQSFEEG